MTEAQVNNADQNEDQAFIREIEKNVFSRINAGVDLSELNILDDVNVSKRAIEDLGIKIAANNPELAATILKIAHSIYFGQNLQEANPDFFDAVIHLGSDRTKLLIFSLSLLSLEKGPEARVRAAKSASISILSRLIGEQMSIRDDLIRKIETSGLLSQLGKSILIRVKELGMEISDKFIEDHHAELAALIVERLKLDPFLVKIIDIPVVEFDEDSFSLAGIVKLAEALTEQSFRSYGKLVVKSPMPDKDGILIRTPGDMISKLFTALGVEQFVEIQENPTPRQLEAIKHPSKLHPKR